MSVIYQVTILFVPTIRIIIDWAITYSSIWKHNPEINHGYIGSDRPRICIISGILRLDDSKDYAVVGEGWSTIRDGLWLYLVDVVLAGDGQDTLGDAMPELHCIAVEIARRPGFGQSSLGLLRWPWRRGEVVTNVHSHHDDLLLLSVVAGTGKEMNIPVVVEEVDFVSVLTLL